MTRRQAALAALPLLLTAACGDSGATGGDVADGAPAPVDGAPAAVDAAPVDPRCEQIEVDAVFTAHLRITTDDQCEVYVNGTSVGTTSSWPSPVNLDVGLALHPSRPNVVAVRGENLFEQGGNDRSIIGELTYEVDGVPTTLLITDASWKASAVEEEGWEQPGFDDSAWVAATETASHGDGPWGNLLTSTTAKWIWSAPVPASVEDKEQVETAYVRREFYFGFDGTTIGSGPGCPTE